MSQFVYKRTGKEVNLVATGDLRSVVAEIGYIIHRLYSGIKEQAPDAAVLFRAAVTDMVVDPDSGVWSDAERHPGEVMIAHVQKSNKEK